MLDSPFVGIFGLIHLVIVVWAVLQILGSGMTMLQKIAWILIVGLFPLIGLIIYLLIGRKS